VLLIVNCKSIYGSDIVEMSGALKRMGHKIIVIGGPDDLFRDEIFRAESALLADQVAVSKLDTTESRRSIMLGLIDSKEAYLGEALVISDSPYDRAAADSLNIATVSPFDFNFQWVGEETE
jgi:hypothetical protein